MANPAYSNAGHFYAPEVKPVLLNCSFTVDDSQPAGISNLTGPGFSSVFMFFNPITYTNNATFLTGDTVLACDTVASLVVGMLVTDVTNGGAFAPGTVIVSIDSIAVSIKVSSPALADSLPPDAMSYQLAPAAGNPLPNKGYIVVNLSGFHNMFLGSFASYSSAHDSPVGLAGSLSIGQAYVIQSIGSSTLADFQASGFPVGYPLAVGASFIATSTGAGSGSGQVYPQGKMGAITSFIVGDPNLMIQGSLPSGILGSQIILRTMQDSSSTKEFQNGTRINLSLYLSDSSVKVLGQ